MFTITTKTESLSQEQPREKMSNYGPESLNDAELLSCILGTGHAGQNVKELSQSLLNEFGSKGLMQFESIENIQESTGLPPVKSCQILAIAEYFRRIQRKDSTQLKSSEQIYDYVKDAFTNSTFEKLWIICLDNKRRVLYSGPIAQGEGNRIYVTLASIFHNPIRLNAKHFYLIHNHPYGSCKASKEDLQFTLHIKQQAQVFSLAFDDHIIIGDDGFYSFALEGLI